MLFAAVHESASGTKRTFAAEHYFVRYWTRADMPTLRRNEMFQVSVDEIKSLQSSPAGCRYHEVVACQGLTFETDYSGQKNSFLQFTGEKTQA
jgi:hypothetical protein